MQTFQDRNGISAQHPRLLSATMGLALAFAWIHLAEAGDSTTGNLDQQLRNTLAAQGFTGRVEGTLEKRLGRPLNPAKAELGRLLFFDKFVGLHGDNSCAGCHSPLNGFGDSQSMAIGVENNDFVGPERAGPRNQRRTPSVVNTAFYPKLMWNGRFSAISGNPFDNSKGFLFPAPEGTTRFPANDPDFQHLLQAQAHIPPTELSEAAGFTDICGSADSSSVFQARAAGGARLLKEPGSARVRAVFDPLVTSTVRMFGDVPGRERVAGEPDFCQFDVPAIGRTGVPLPPPLRVPRAEGGFDEFRNEPIRDTVIGRINANESYRAAFKQAFPELKDNEAITFAMFGQAIAEFEFSVTFMNAPVDRFARGESKAMADAQKRGALVFFNKANCVQCHAVAGGSNELFSDFENHVAGIPQIGPKFGAGLGDVPFRNAKGQFTDDGNQDFGNFDITEGPTDIYKFRTSPLRNLAIQPAFFHNGSFISFTDALRHHLDALHLARSYDPVAEGVAPDLTQNTGPIDPVLRRIDPLLANPVRLSAKDFADLQAFLRDGLLDPRALPENLVSLIPTSLPSGLSPHTFETSPPTP